MSQYPPNPENTGPTPRPDAPRYQPPSDGTRPGGRLDFGDLDDKSPRAIHQDIRETRSRFDEHLDELAAHLTPKALMHELGEALREGGSMMSKAVARNVARYPMPSAVIGAGLAWLVSSRRDRKHPQPKRSPMRRTGTAPTSPRSNIYGTAGAGGPAGGYRNDDVEEDLYVGSEYGDDLPQLTSDELAVLGTVYPEYGSYHELESESSRYAADDTSESAMSYRQRLEAARARARDAAADAAERAKEGGSSVMESVRKAVSRVTDMAETAGRGMRRAASATSHGLHSGRHAAGEGVHQAAHLGSNAMHRVSAVGSQAVRSLTEGSRQLKSSVSTSGERMVETVRESADRAPLTTGLACLAVGLVAGLLIPSTRREDEAFGPMADDLKERAASTARDAAQRAKEAARTTAQAAVEAAKEEGLTPSALKEHVAHVAASTRDAVTEAVKSDVKEEGLTPGGLKEKAAHVVERTVETAKQEFSQQAADSEGAKAAKDMNRPAT